MDKFNLKRLLSLTLSLLMLVSVVACAKKGDEAETANNGEVVSSIDEEVETDRSQRKDGVPDDFTLDGQVIRIMCRDTDLRQMDVDGGGEMLGDVIHEAVFKRNEIVKERLKCDFEITAIGGDFETFGSTMENLIFSGDDSFDIINTPGNSSLTSQRDYLFLPLENNKWLNFEEPWWNINAMNEISKDGVKIR